MPVWKSIVLGPVMALAVIAGAAAQSWSEYRPAAGHYRIEMPGTPKVEKIPVTNNDGSKTELVQATVELPDAVYMVSYLDYGPNLDAYKTVSTIRARFAAMGTMHSKKPPYPGQPGFEITLDRHDGIFINARVLLEKPRLFQMVVTSHSADYRPDTQRFFDSFKPLPN